MKKGQLVFIVGWGYGTPPKLKFFKKTVIEAVNKKSYKVDGFLFDIKSLKIKHNSYYGKGVNSYQLYETMTPELSKAVEELKKLHRFNRFKEKFAILPEGMQRYLYECFLKKIKEIKKEDNPCLKDLKDGGADPIVDNFTIEDKLKVVTTYVKE